MDSGPDPDLLSGPCAWVQRPLPWFARIMAWLGMEPEFYTWTDMLGVPGRTYRWRRGR